MLRRRVRNGRVFIARRCALTTAFAVGVSRFGSCLRRRRSRWGRLRWAPDCEPSSNSTDTGRRQFHQPVPARRRPSLRQRTGHRRTSSSCSTPTTTASPTRSACWTRWRRFESLPQFNIWAGRFLPPSDRANLYGPFYAHEWGVYTDGIQDGYPFVFQGRDNGVVYWGDFAKKMKVSAGRVRRQVRDRKSESAWAPPASRSISGIKEDGYYLNGTYYGDKNLLAIGGATQVQDGHTASTVDFLLERKLPNGGVVIDRKRVFQLQPAGRLRRGLRQEPGRVRLASYLFPKVVRRQSRQVRDPRQVCQGGVHPRDDRQATTRKPPKSTSTTSSSSSMRA